MAISSEENGQPGFVKMEVVESLNRETVDKFVSRHVTPASKIESDGLKIYNGLGQLGYQHERVVISNDKEQGLKTFKWLHTVISNAKAFIIGTFHGLDRCHLQAYLDEFCYRFNRRFWEPELFNRLLNACVSAKPVTFTELTA